MIHGTEYQKRVNYRVNKKVLCFLLSLILYLLLCYERGEKAMSSKVPLTIDSILADFSFWLPRARKYGFKADELYLVSDDLLSFAVPIPILNDGDFSLWLFQFANAETVTPRTVHFILSTLNKMVDSKLLHLIHFRHHYIIAENVTARIPPRISRSSTYVIKAEHSCKIYEIISKAIFNFSQSFRSNLKFGDSLLNLCDELEIFSDRLRKRAEEIRGR